MRTLFSYVCLTLIALAFTASAHASIEVSKSIERDLTEVDTGQEFNYVLQYRNPSTTIAEFRNVTITDVLDPNLEFRGFEGTSDVASHNFDFSSRTLTINFVDPLEAGKTGEMKVRVRFKQGVTPDGTIADNQATIDADNADADLSEVVSIAGRASDQTMVQKELLGSGIPLDQNVTYRLSFRNEERTASLNHTSITMVDTLPDNAVFVGASDSGIHDAIANTVTWTQPLLEVDRTMTRTVTVKFLSQDFAVDDRVTNMISVTSTPIGGTETTRTDSVTHVIVSPKSDLRFSKNVDKKFTYEGKPIAVFNS